MSTMDTQLLRDLGATLFQSRHIMTLLFSGDRLTLAEMLALQGIEKNARDSTVNVYADDLQHLLYVSKPAISQMMKSLEKSGYITREINPDNRRKLNVILTNQGREALREAGDHYKEMFTELVARFGEDKTRQLIALFTEFVDAAKSISREVTIP